MTYNVEMFYGCDQEWGMYRRSLSYADALYAVAKCAAVHGSLAKMTDSNGVTVFALAPLGWDGAAGAMPQRKRKYSDQRYVSGGSEYGPDWVCLRETVIKPLIAAQ